MNYRSRSIRNFKFVSQAGNVEFSANLTLNKLAKLYDVVPNSFIDSGTTLVKSKSTGRIYTLVYDEVIPSLDQ